MSKIHYYFGWFEGTIPKQIADLLNKDLKDKKSIAIITTAPADNEYTDGMLAFAKDTWFEPAGAWFEEYHSIDYRISKEKAQELLKNASAILLHGGYAAQLKGFIAEYEMADVIKQSNAAVIMGASAGGMNMAAKFAHGDYVDENTRKPATVYEGLALDNFALQSHAAGTLETIATSDHAKNYLMPLSQEIDVCIACTESTIRMEGSKCDIMGDVYLITKGKVTKMPESL